MVKYAEICLQIIKYAVNAYILIKMLNPTKNLIVLFILQLNKFKLKFCKFYVYCFYAFSKVYLSRRLATHSCISHNASLPDLRCKPSTLNAFSKVVLKVSSAQVRRCKSFESATKFESDSFESDSCTYFVRSETL